MRALYWIASYLVFWALLPGLLLSRKTRGGFLQRLGLYPRGALPVSGGRRVWFHGASAGDLLALSPMARLLRERFPDAKLVFSTITNTGYLMGHERLRGDVDAIVYAPLDLPGATRRAVEAIRPDVLVLEYAEIWPNLIRAVRRAGAQVILTNGRFSPAQVPRYRLLFRLIGNPLKELTLLLMRERDEAERALRLGAPEDRVLVTGNTKFDVLGRAAATVSEQSLRESLGLEQDALVLICGSTHEGEEEQLLGVFKRLLLDYPRLRLVLAPRYIERASRVVGLAEAAGLSVALRSSAAAAPHAQVVVLDTIGELASVYQVATLVFVGGSFTRRGGQNILEPAAHGKPVLFGPCMDNFRDSVQVLVGRGGIQLNDADHLYSVVAELLSRPASLRALGALAREAVGQVSGASARNVERIVAILERAA